jgi:CRP-like cAMP-binding protein
MRMRTYLRLDHYVVDVLMRDLAGHDRRPAAFLVYLHLWAETRGAERRTMRTSHNRIATSTGLSRRTVQNALALLVRRKLVRVIRDRPTAIPEYLVACPWRR